MKKEDFKALIKENLQFFMSIPACVWVIIFFYIPLMTILGRSFFVRSDVTACPHPSLENYAAFCDCTYVTIITRSLLLAFITAAACLAIAYPVAYYIARHVKNFKNILLFLVMLPFSVNMLIQAYSWFFMLGKMGLINAVLLKLGLISHPLSLLNTSGAVYVGVIYCYVPFMVLPLYTTLEKIDARFIEASLDLGASWAQTFIRVIIPLSLPGISTGFFLVFIPAFGEFVIPALLGGGKQMYVSSLISYYFLTTRNLALGSAFTLLSSAAVLLVAYVMYSWLKKVRS
jgi:spermidine/putrescine transport system permease protein